MNKRINCQLPSLLWKLLLSLAIWFYEIFRWKPYPAGTESEKCSYTVCGSFYLWVWKNAFLHCIDEERAFRGRNTRDSCISLTVSVFYCCKEKCWGNTGQGWGQTMVESDTLSLLPFHRLSAGAALLCPLKRLQSLLDTALEEVNGLCCKTSVLCHIWFKALAYF